MCLPQSKNCLDMTGKSESHLPSAYYTVAIHQLVIYITSNMLAMKSI